MFARSVVKNGFEANGVTFFHRETKRASFQVGVEVELWNDVGLFGQGLGALKTVQSQVVDLGIVLEACQKIDHRIGNDQSLRAENPLFRLLLPDSSIHSPHFHAAQQGVIERLQNLGINVRRKQGLGPADNPHLVRPAAVVVEIRLVEDLHGLTGPGAYKVHTGWGQNALKVGFGHADNQRRMGIHARQIENVRLPIPVPADRLVVVPAQGKDVAFPELFQVALHGAQVNVESIFPKHLVNLLRGATPSAGHMLEHLPLA